MCIYVIYFDIILSRHREGTMSQNRLKSPIIFEIWEKTKIQKLKCKQIARDMGVAYHSVVGTAARLDKYIYNVDSIQKKNKNFLRAAGKAKQYLADMEKPVEQKKGFFSFLFNRIFS